MVLCSALGVVWRVTPALPLEPLELRDELLDW